MFRTDQYRGDILCILLRVKELLLSLSPNLLHLTKPGRENPKLALIHAKVIVLVKRRRKNTIFADTFEMGKGRPPVCKQREIK